MLTVGGLFSGIGGWELGLERAGMRVLWHCEADAFCRRVLERNWPDVPVYPDVRALRGVDVEPVDVLCGGFPCQDISVAGRGAGIGGERSGLWGEFARLIGELRPRYVLVENVSALTARGLDVVLGDLAARGFDAEWDCLPASAFGAPHQRDRLWLVAYPCSDGVRVVAERDQREGREVRAAVGGDAVAVDDGAEGVVADADQERRGGRTRQLGPGRGPESAHRSGGEFQDADGGALQSWRIGGRAAQAGGPEWWAVEPPVGRVAHGVPDRLDQLAALGNALVPQISEWIGRRILEWEGC